MKIYIFFFFENEIGGWGWSSQVPLWIEREERYSYFLQNKSSCECKKVISAVLLFCKVSSFVFRFLLFFIVFGCLFFFFTNIELLYTQTWAKAGIVHFLPAFSLSVENSILPKMSVITPPWCIHVTKCSRACIVIICMEKFML